MSRDLSRTGCNESSLLIQRYKVSLLKWEWTISMCYRYTGTLGTGMPSSPPCPTTEVSSPRKPSLTSQTLLTIFHGLQRDPKDHLDGKTRTSLRTEPSAHDSSCSLALTFTSWLLLIPYKFSTLSWSCGPATCLPLPAPPPLILRVERSP